jgi:hypothetical protein
LHSRRQRDVCLHDWWCGCILTCEREHFECAERLQSTSSTALRQPFKCLCLHCSSAQAILDPINKFFASEKTKRRMPA